MGGYCVCEDGRCRFPLRQNGFKRKCGFEDILCGDEVGFWGVVGGVEVGRQGEEGGEWVDLDILDIMVRNGALDGRIVGVCDVCSICEGIA